MKTNMDTITIENEFLIPFCKKTPLSIERGMGVQVWDEQGNEYLDFTSGWAVTSLGHTHPIITQAIAEQCGKIIHNPNSGLTYSPARAKLLLTLNKILPPYIGKCFFVNSGAEAIDAAIKLARKITGRRTVIATAKSFHGRTLAATSATGQTEYRKRFNVLVPHFTFVPFNDLKSLARAIDDDTAAVLVEPIQGEGGIIVPDDNYLPEISRLCRESGVLMVVDEIQTGFYRTGPAFASLQKGVHADFLTMAKGIAGGFPFGCVAAASNIVQRIEDNDHGGTYNGNPLGCAVASAVIEFMLSTDLQRHVERTGNSAIAQLQSWKVEFPELIRDVRGKGLLLALELCDPDQASFVHDECIKKGLLLNIKHGTIIRIFPALTITKNELDEGFSILKSALDMMKGVRKGQSLI
jgi:acetylornithine/N-succinyldiaminopimelate aminotransferase